MSVTSPVTSRVTSPVVSRVTDGQRRGVSFRITDLFRDSEVGAWYDPSDISTLFQDHLGTTPVTASGQVVGLTLDKSQQQSFETRRNLLTHTEAIDNAVWVKSNITVLGSRLTATITASFAFLGQVSKTRGTGAHTITWEVKYVNNPWIAVNYGAAKTTAVFFNIQTGSKGIEAAGYTGTITTLTDGWYRVSVTGSPGDNEDAYILVCNGDDDVTATASRSVDARFPQLELGTTATPYQEVGALFPASWPGNHAYQASTDSKPLYDVTSGLASIKFDGIDDFLETAAIDFTGTDKMAVFAGVRKLSDAARGTIAELSATIASNNGAFYLAAPNAASATFAWESKGTTLREAIDTGIAAPATRVLAAIGDIAGGIARLRINGVQEAEDLGDQGTGNYGNYKLYVGRRAGSSLPFNGHIYGLTIRGAATDLETIEKVESILAGRTGVTL